MSAAARDGATVVLAKVPFPIADAGQAVQAYLDAASPRTRLALVSQVTSPTALVMPVVAIVRELARRGIDTLVDGAHAPGMIPCDVRALNAAYWTGNGHKWLCAPKGSGLLHVRADLRAQIRPLATSHGANSERSDRSAYRLAFDWQGTLDPSPWLTLPAAIRFVGGLHEDGWAGLMAANRVMARDARDRLCNALGIPAPAPDAMVGAMASVPLAGIAATDEAAAQLQAELLEEDGIEVPVLPFPVRGALGRRERRPTTRSSGSAPSATTARTSTCGWPTAWRRGSRRRSRRDRSSGVSAAAERQAAPVEGDALAVDRRRRG